MAVKYWITNNMKFCRIGMQENFEISFFLMLEDKNELITFFKILGKSQGKISSKFVLIIQSCQVLQSNYLKKYFLSVFNLRPCQMFSKLKQRGMKCIDVILSIRFSLFSKIYVYYRCVYPSVVFIYDVTQIAPHSVEHICLS